MTLDTRYPPRPMHPYAPRPIVPDGVLAHDGWRLKRYRITAGDAPADRAAFDEGAAILLAALPSPACTEARAGLGFLILHRGRGADYAVLGWWDRENELPTRVAVREQKSDAAWRPARASESFCVWDLQVIGFERDAYVDTVLRDGDPTAADEYLARWLERRA